MASGRPHPLEARPGLDIIAGGALHPLQLQQPKAVVVQLELLPTERKKGDIEERQRVSRRSDSRAAQRHVTEKSAGAPASPDKVHVRLPMLVQVQRSPHALKSVLKDLQHNQVMSNLVRTKARIKKSGSF